MLFEDERITEADLRLAVAVQTTNGASLHFPPGLGLGLGVGVFPGQAFLNPWNNGKEVPRWGIAEIQKMSPSTTGRCK